MFGSAPQTGPTDEELAAARLAKLEKQEEAQDDLTRETDRLFRLYTARSAFGNSPSRLSA